MLPTKEKPSFSLVEQRYLFWEIEKSPTWLKCKEERDICSFSYCLFVVIIDISEKLHKAYDIDPFLFVPMMLDRKNRENEISHLDESDDSSSEDESNGNDAHDNSSNASFNAISIDPSLFTFDNIQKFVYDSNLFSQSSHKTKNVDVNQYFNRKNGFYVLHHEIIKGIQLEDHHASRRRYKCYNPVSRKYKTQNNSAFSNNIDESSWYEPQLDSYPLNAATFTEFVNHFASICSLIDEMDSFMNLNWLERTEERGSHHKVTEKQHEVNLLMIEFCRVLLIPVLFYSLWLIKNMSKNCDKTSGHQLGPIDRHMRLFTELGFSGNKEIFMECNDEESVSLCDSLWRSCLRLGKHFNLFGLPKIRNTPKETLAVITNVNLNNFKEVFVEESWEKSFPSNNAEFFYSKKPILKMGISDIWKLITCLSQKSNRLLDSEELRLFLTILWSKLDSFISSACLEEYTYDTHGYLFYNMNEMELPNTKDFECFLSESKKILPSFFNEISIVKYQERESIEKLVTRTSVFFSQYTELLMSYFVELTSVSDFMYNKYPHKLPSVPSPNFCEKWIVFCLEMAKDLNITDFIKRKFEYIYWTRNQFYGETEKYNVNTKIVQTVPITSILIQRRYRNFEIITSLLGRGCDDIFEFASERIARCKSQNDMKNLFLPCWEHHRVAILKNPPSRYLKCLVFEPSPTSSISSIPTSAPTVHGNISREIHQKLSSNIVEKEHKELENLLKSIETEKYNIASLQSGSSSIHKTQEAGDNSGMIESLHSNKVSIIQKAMKSLNSYSSVLEKQSKLFSIAEADEEFMMRKLLFVPVGIVEYNIIQESILSVISTKNYQMMSVQAKDFGILTNMTDVNNNDQIIHHNKKNGMTFTTYNARDMLDTTGASVLDRLFAKSKYHTIHSDVDTRTTQHFDNNTNMRLAINDLMNNNGHNNESDEEPSDDGDDEDSDYQEDMNTYDEEFASNSSRKKRGNDNGGDKATNTKMNMQGKKMREIPKEFPEVMNFDLLETRQEREKMSLERPLSLLECSFSVKRHALFSRSVFDRPCFFLFFNSYMMCDGKNVFNLSYPYATKHSSKIKQRIGGYTNPLEFAVILGCIIKRLEESTEELIKKFREGLHHQNSHENEDGVNANHSESKDEIASKIIHIQNYYKTFPEVILKATLGYERVFNMFSSEPNSGDPADMIHKRENL